MCMYISTGPHDLITSLSAICTFELRSSCQSENLCVCGIEEAVSPLTDGPLLVPVSQWKFARAWTLSYCMPFGVI